MIAGRLKYRIELQRPVSADDPYGDRPARGSFEPVAVVRAERVRLSGQRRMDAREEFSDFTAVYRIRDAHKADNGWCVRDLSSGVLYDVVAVEPNRDRGMLQLICRRVNE